MASISAAMVKDLREKTGAGMMDCKAALTETSGDVEAAVDWLRKKGLSKAAKKSGRVAAEGLVSVLTSGKTGVVVEINSETDFVARNDAFQDLARSVAKVALETGASDVEALSASAYPGGGTVSEAVANAIATIGENMTVRRVQSLAVQDGVVAQYVHGSVGEGLGKIGVIVALESKGDREGLAALARLVALHIAAANPQALDASGLDPAVVERERNVLREKNAGKPAQVLDKIVESGLKSYFKEVSLLDQPSIHAEHANKAIGDVLKEAAKGLGAPVAIKGMVRFALGEGVERQEQDFASEVAAVVQGG